MNYQASGELVAHDGSLPDQEPRPEFGVARRCLAPPDVGQVGHVLEREKPPAGTGSLRSGLVLLAAQLGGCNCVPALNFDLVVHKRTDGL